MSDHDLRAAAVAIVKSEDGRAFQLGLSCAAKSGAHSLDLLAERYDSRDDAASAAESLYPGVPIMGATQGEVPV